jgi:hypothetical protein
VVLAAAAVASNIPPLFRPIHSFRRKRGEKLEKDDADFRRVLVRGGYRDVCLERRKLSLCYWPGPSFRVLRASWCVVLAALLNLSGAGTLSEPARRHQESNPLENRPEFSWGEAEKRETQPTKTE